MLPPLAITLFHCLPLLIHAAAAFHCHIDAAAIHADAMLADMPHAFATFSIVLLLFRLLRCSPLLIFSPAAGFMPCRWRAAMLLFAAVAAADIRRY